MRVFGLNHLSRKVPELLMKEIENKYDPDKWDWVPAKPEKIKNIIKIVDEEKKSVRFAAITNYQPKEEKQSLVLMFYMGNLNYGLLKNLEEEGIKYFFIDYPQLILQGKVSIILDESQSKKLIRVGDLEADLEDVKIVLWNPPRFPNPIFDWDVIPKKRGRNAYLFRKRWMQFLRDLQHLIPQDAKWIPGNVFSGSQEWQNKVGEYFLAKKIGFKVPPIICTNDIDELKRFASNHGSTLLLREFSTPPFSFPPIKVNIDKTSLKFLKNAPCCFQKYIEKIFELRIIVLFDKIFPCKIYSQDSELARYDWRVHDDAKVKWELTELPTEVKQNLIEMRKKLGLNWISVDMIFATDKQYYFLEANRPGAHYWLDLFIGLDITEKIVNEIKMILRPSF